MADQSFTYAVRTEGDPSGLNTVKDALEKVRGAAEKLGGQGLGKFVGDAAELASVAGMLELARKSLEKFAETEELLVAQHAALKQRSQDTAEYREKLEELVETQEKLTGVDSDRWRKALTIGIQAGANPAQIDKFAEMTKNAAGLPQIFGNIEVAAEAVGKAVSGNLEPFTRLGFVFSENATLAHKLDELSQQLATRGGGQLEERSKTLHGQFKNLSNAATDLFRTLGKGANDTGLVQSVTYGLAKSLGVATTAVKGLLETSPALKQEIKGIGEEMLTAEQRAQRLQTTLDAIRKGPEEAGKKREEFGTKLSKENQVKVDAATDAAGLETAKVNALESMGLLKPEEAEKQRRKIAGGLESTKQKIGISELDTQIANRKIGLDESHSSVASAASKLQDEEAKLERFKKFAEEEQKTQRRFDNRLEPLKAEAEKRLLATHSGIYSREEIDTDVAAVPEIASLNQQKEKALLRLRKKNGRYDVASQEDEVAKARAKADATFEAGTTNSENIAAEMAELQKQRDQLALKNRIQTSTRALGDFQAVYGATTQAQNGQQGSAAGNPAAAIGGNLNQVATAVARNTDTTGEILRVSQELARHLLVEQRRGIDHTRELQELRRLNTELSAQVRNNPGRGL
jgi:hypothetical protein